MILLAGLDAGGGRVIEDSVRALLPIARLRGWQLRAIGRRTLLPGSLRRILDEAEAETAAARRLVVQFAIGYGGREEILDALRRWADEPAVRDQNAGAALRTLTAADLARHLYAADLADPDLILRTSGEIRLSGSCCGRASTTSSTSPTSSGRSFARSTSCVRSATTSADRDASAAERPRVRSSRDGNATSTAG